MSEHLLEVQNLTKHFPILSGVFLKQTATVHALDGVSIGVKPGETLCVVGESGCGKKTLGRTLLRLYDPTQGKIFFNQQDITHLPNKELRALRVQMQMIFQDPQSSLNPRMTVMDTIAESLLVNKLVKNLEEAEPIVLKVPQGGLGAHAETCGVDA